MSAPGIYVDKVVLRGDSSSAIKRAERHLREANVSSTAGAILTLSSGSSDETSAHVALDSLFSLNGKYITIYQYPV